MMNAINELRANSRSICLDFLEGYKKHGASDLILVVVEVDITDE